MQAQATHYTAHVANVRASALALAYVEGASFTVASFCSSQGFKDNRHTRRALNQMVEDGKLVKHKMLFGDGHYRMLYCAQKTTRMFRGF